VRVAAVDIGTNSVLLLIVEDAGGKLVRLHDACTITRLGQGVDESGVLADEALERTLACLESYAAVIRESQVERVGAVGTSAMRDARGGDRFLAEAERLLGVRPEVISGAREAALTFDGALAGLELAGRVAVFDVGGGSTEVIVGELAPDGPRIESAVSLDIGSVRLTERHVKSDPPAPSELAAVRADVLEALATAPDARGLPLVGVAGTVTTLAAVARGIEPYDGSAVHGLRLARVEVGALAARLAGTPLAERRALRGLEPARADVIVAGATIVDAVCGWAGASALVASDGGVRWGVARALLGAN
jgi:exopolyphosphatase / guanosine-5'-triphosphate,3'-diphosphate pyrophosphatase